MRLPPEFITELKMRNDIESVISPYVVLKRKGNNFVGLCPFHSEKTGSFTIWPEKGSYYCFGCGAGGDAISFMMQIEHLDYIEAVKVLADRCGLQMPTDGVDDKVAKLKAQIYEANREAAKFFYEKLITPEGKTALEYLTKRGLKPKTIKQFGLGYAPNSWDAMIKHLHTLGFNDYVLDQAGLVVKTKKGNYIDRFRNRVMYPVIDIRGNFIAFSGRKLSEDDPGGKYINTADTPVYHKGSNMFAMNFAKNYSSKRIILVEGNMDVISLHQAGFPMTVAALGTAFTPDQARLLSRYTEEVVVTMDADGAGAKSTDKVLRILGEAGVKARILRLPDCKDPDEYIIKHGAARFEALLDGAVSDIEYRLHIASDGLDIETSDGKLEYLKRAVTILATLSDDMAKELYSGKLSELCGVSKESILKSVRDTSEKNKKKVVRKELDSIVNPPVSRDDINPEKRFHIKAAAAEESVNAILIKHPDLYEKAIARITAEDFVTDFSRRVFEAISSVLATRSAFDLSLLGGDFSPRELGYISMLENTAIVGDKPEKTLYDSIEVIKLEKEKSSSKSIGEMTDDEWTTHLNKIANDKKK